MKKAEKYIYLIIIVILVGVIIGGSVYFLNKDKDDKQPVNDKEDSKEKENDNKYFKVDKYDYTINGKKHVIAFNYSTEIINVENEPNIYDNYVTVSLDGKIIEDTKTFIQESEPITSNNIKTVKGTDKDYIVVIMPLFVGIDGLSMPIILGDDGTLAEVLGDTSFWTIMSMDSKAEEFYGKNHNVPSESGPAFNSYKIMEDAIYYLVRDPDDETTDGYKLDEYKATIKNGKVEKEKIGEYKGMLTQTW